MNPWSCKWWLMSPHNIILRQRAYFCDKDSSQLPHIPPTQWEKENSSTFPYGTKYDSSATVFRNFSHFKQSFNANEIPLKIFSQPQLLPSKEAWQNHFHERQQWRKNQLNFLFFSCIKTKKKFVGKEMEKLLAEATANMEADRNCPLI